MIDRSGLWLRFGISLLIVGLLAVPVGAQESDVEEMEQVEVTAEAMDVRLSGDLAQYGSQVDVITSEDMDQAGVTTINDALNKLAPGVHVPSKMGPFSGARIRIQGASKREVVWMVDGIRLSNRAFTSFRNNIAPQFIQRIEIIKGPQGIIYGSEGIVGIINIITKDIQPSGKGSVKVSGSLGQRDYNSSSQHGDVSGRQGKHSYLVFGNNNTGQNRPFRETAFETTASRSARKRRYEVQNVGVKYRYDMGENEDLLFFSQFNRADLDWVRPHNLIDAGNERNQLLSYVKWNKDVSEQTNLFAKAYYHQWDSDWTFIGQDTTPQAQAFSVDDQWYFDEVGLTTMVDHTRPGGSQFLAGLDLKEYTGKNEIGMDWGPTSEQLVAPFLIVRPKLSALPKTNLSAGVRYTMLDLTEDQFAWNASMRHPLESVAGALPWTSSLDLRLMAGKGFSLPKITEITTSTEPGFTATLGNDDLEAIEATSFEVGVEGSGSYGEWPLSYGVNYFHRDKDQGILTEFTDASQDTKTFVNTDGTEEAQGIETELLLRPDDGWRVQLSATYTDVTDSKSLNTSGGDQATNRPDWIGKSVVRFDHPDEGWGYQLTGNYVGDMRDIGDRTDAGLSAGLDPDYGDYFVADVSAYTFLDEEENQRLSLAIENLFDNDYAAQLDEGTRTDGSSYRYDRLGAPLNATLSYTHRF